MSNAETIIGAAWLRAVDKVMEELKLKDNKYAFRKVDASFGTAMDSFWDSMIENQISDEEIYSFAQSFFLRYYKDLLGKP